MGGAAGKTVAGHVGLGGQKAEEFLAKFSFLPNVDAKVTGHVRTKRSAWALHDLRVNLYDDEAWDKYQALLRKGSLCKERQQLASQSFKIDAQHSMESGGMVEPELLMYIPKSIQNRRHRTYYWFAVMADCSIEDHNIQGLPVLDFELSFFNGDSHLPADETGMLWRLYAVLLFMLALGGLIARQTHRRVQAGRQLHLVTVLLGAAFALQILAVWCETCHLRVYAKDGKGLRWRHHHGDDCEHGLLFLPLDFFGEVFQGLSELLISLILVFLACGWTMLTLGDAGFDLGLADPESLGGAARAGRPAGPGGAPKDSVLGALLEVKRQLMRDPTSKRALTRLVAFGRAFAEHLRRPAAVFSRVTFGSVFIGGLTVVQLYLEWAGRAFEDDFNQFHDHEHWPGMALVGIRVLLAGIFALGSASTMKLLSDPDAQKYMKQLAILGGAWLLAFPACVISARLLPAYRRHGFVSMASLLLQTVALGGLGVLVGSSRYKHVSSASGERASSAAIAPRSRKLAVD